MVLTLPILEGTQDAYNAIISKDPGMIYITTDAGNIYLGDIKLGGTEIGRVVEDITFAEDTQTFTIIYTDETTKEIDLVLESVIKDIDFDTVTKVLTFTLVSGATTDISLANLMDIYTGGTTDTTNTTVIDGEIKVDVTISAASGNVVTGTGTGIGDSGRAIISEITDTTTGTGLPDVAAIKKVLTIGTF